MTFKGTYESYWSDNLGQMHHISKECEITNQSRKIIDFRLRRDEILGMTKLFDCVIAGDNCYPVSYGSIQPIGFNGVWLNLPMYEWLRDATFKPVSYDTPQEDIEMDR